MLNVMALSTTEKFLHNTIFMTAVVCIAICIDEKSISLPVHIMEKGLITNYGSNDISLTSPLGMVDSENAPAPTLMSANICMGGLTLEKGMCVESNAQ